MLVKWLDKEIQPPTEEEIKEMSPLLKSLFIANLKEFIEEETRPPARCNCDCHYDPGIMHMIACCDKTYLQYK